MSESIYTGALDALIRAADEKDGRRAEYWVRVALVCAIERHSDKLEEATAALGAVAEQAIEANAELSATVKKATNAVVVELRKATVREAA